MSEPIQVVKPNHQGASPTDYDRMQDAMIRKLERYIEKGVQ